MHNDHHPPAPAPPGTRLLDLVRDAIRRKHYSYRTEQAYVFWIKRFIFFNGKRHPRELGEAEVTAFLNHLARVPTVLTFAEVRRLLAQMDGTKWLMASLIYGAGLRLRECLKLRVKDIEFDYAQVIVRDGKGGTNSVRA